MTYATTPALRRMQRAVAAFTPGSPPLTRYSSVQTMRDPAEVERREQEAREYRQRYDRYVRLRDGLLVSIDTMRPTFLGADDLTEVIVSLTEQAAWPVPVPTENDPVPLASQPVTCAISRNAPPLLSIPSGAPA